MRAANHLVRGRSRKLVALIVICTGAWAGLLGRTYPVTAQSVDRVALVQSFFDALARGDVDAMVDTFADTAVLQSPAGPCSMPNPCVGHDAIRARFQGLVAGHQCQTATNFDVTGSIVAARNEVRSDAIRANGIERVIAVSFFQIPRDKFTFVISYNDLTDPQTAANAAINAGTLAPGAPIPNPDTPCE